MKTHQNNNKNSLFILLALVFLLLAMAYVMKTNMMPVETEMEQSIQSSEELQQIAKELDGTNIDASFDPGLKEVAADASAM